MRLWLSVLFVLVGVTARAATFTAADVTRPSVLTAYNLCSDGDTLAIPAGSASWSTPLNVANAITIQGAGIGSTIISNDISGYFTPMFDITLVANKTNRMTGIEFRYSADNDTSAAIAVTGANTDARRIRIDHCKFLDLRCPAVRVETALGCFDHNIGTARAGYNSMAHVKDSVWNGKTRGNGAWGEASPLFGTESFFFFEDNTWTGTSLIFYSSLIDAQAGGRYVFRHNTIVRGYVEGHGSEAQYERSTHAVEIYNNTIDQTGIFPLVTYYRGGSGIIFSNAISGVQGNSTPFSLLNNRMNDSLFQPYGGADGRNHWDVNDAGNPFDTATVTSAGTLSATASAESWTVNQWAGYTIRKTSGKSVSSITRSGTTLTVTCPSHGFNNTVQSVYSIQTPGSGYTLGDTLTLSGGTGTAGTLTVTAVSGGTVTAATVLSAGSYSAMPGIEYFGDVNVTGGTGSGCKVRLAYTHVYASIFGATQQEYNALFTTDSIDANTFRCYTVGALPTTPATGTIKACVGNYFSEISANTANTITFKDSGFGSIFRMTFTAGDTFEINKVTHVMDQVGRTGGTLIDDTVTPAFPGAWNDQVSSPWYQWSNNFGTQTGIGFSSASGSIVNGLHYSNNVAKPGYTPYTYPHPLAGGSDTNIPAITSINAYGTNGVAFYYPITATHSPFTGYSATNLPAGLSLNQSTGDITGTPTASGVTTVGLYVTNAYGFGWTNIMVDVVVMARSPYLMTTGISPNDSSYSQNLVRTLPYTYTLCAIDYLVWTNAGGVTYYDALYSLNSASSMLWTFYNVPTNAIISFVPEVIARYPLIWAIQPINEEADYSIVQSTIALYSAAVSTKPLVGPAWVNNQSDTYVSNLVYRGVFTNLDSFAMHDYLQVPGNGGLSNPPWPEGSWYHPYENPPGGFTNFYGRLVWMMGWTNQLRTNYPTMPKIMVTEFGLFVSNIVDAVCEATNIVSANVIVGLGAPEGPAGLPTSVPYSHGCYSQSNMVVVWSPSMLAFLGALTNQPSSGGGTPSANGTFNIGTLRTF